MAKTQTAPSPAPGPGGTGTLDRFFEISQRRSTVTRELRGGLVTFFTMAYIVVLNPLIIGTQADSTGGFLGGGDIGRAKLLVAAATALVAGVMTILMGVVANYPLALATGLGLNAFVAFGIAKLPGMTWPDAMGLVVMEGIIITILVLTGFRRAVLRAVPTQLKTAISVGIGLFIAFIGLVDAGVVRKPTGPVPVELGIGGLLSGWPTVVFIAGLLAIIAMLLLRVKGAILLGIVGATILAIIIEAIFHVGSQTDATGQVVNPTGWGLNVPNLPSSIVDIPDFGLLGQFSLLGSFSKIGFVAAALLVFTLMLADFFDTMGTMVAIGAEAGLLDKDGDPPNSQRILTVDSLAAVAGGAASVTTGVLFLLATFLAPLVAIVPYEAATPALVIVGFLMMQQVKGISWDDLEIAIPAFLTIVLMPFTYSITAGIGAGFVTYVFIKLIRRKARVIHPLMWLVAGLFVVYFALDPIKAVLHID